MNDRSRLVVGGVELRRVRDLDQRLAVLDAEARLVEVGALDHLDALDRLQVGQEVVEFLGDDQRDALVGGRLALRLAALLADGLERLVLRLDGAVGSVRGRARPVPGDVRIGDVVDLVGRPQLAPVLDLLSGLVVHRIAGLDLDLAGPLAAGTEGFTVLVMDGADRRRLEVGDLDALGRLVGDGVDAAQRLDARASVDAVDPT